MTEHDEQNGIDFFIYRIDIKSTNTILLFQDFINGQEEKVERLRSPAIILFNYKKLLYKWKKRVSLSRPDNTVRIVILRFQFLFNQILQRFASDAKRFHFFDQLLVR